MARDKVQLPHLHQLGQTEKDKKGNSQELQTSTVNAKSAVLFAVNMLMFLSTNVISVMLHLVIIMVDAAMGSGQELQPHQFATMEVITMTTG